MNITDAKQEQKLMPLLRLGFRPFFLCGAIFAFAAMAFWLLALNGWISFTPLNGIMWWHSHEMLFGFVPAIVSGFLLTAVQTWSGMPSVKGNKLLFLLVVWFMARLLIVINPGIPFEIIMIVDLSFLPLVGFFLALPLVKIKQYHNLVFIPILAFMTIANLFTYLPQLGFAANLNTQGLHAMVVVTTLLVSLLGGRVIPMFTANGTKTEKVLPKKWLELSALGSLLIIFFIFISGLSQYHLVIGSLCVVSAALHFYRIMRWRFWVTLQVPLVWILHLSMVFVPIGLLLLGLHFLFAVLSLSAALHSLTVGVIGGMILAMMSRVSLGHTGRSLQVTWLMILAFVAIIMAAITRSMLVAILPEFMPQLWLLSGILWCIAFACFIWVYLPILSTPRKDGRPG